MNWSRKTTTYRISQLWLQALVITTLALPQLAFGQSADTVYLEEVHINASAISKFGTGARVTSLDSTDLNMAQSQGIATAISGTTPIYIKSYGNGMLSTISFRGTGASHTSVRWQGVDIGYPMLGQSDLSVLPIYLNQKITLQHGSSSSLYGSGAIGGVVNLASYEPKAGWAATLSQEFGSFSSSFTAGQVSFANTRFSIQAKGFFTSSQNDFPYTNTTLPGAPTETQQNADYLGNGASVDTQLHIAKNGRLKIAGQYVFFDRGLQPSMNTISSSDRQIDESYRGMLAYELLNTSFDFEVKYLHLLDNISFNGQRTTSNQDIISLDFEQALGKFWYYQLGTQLKYIQVKSPFLSNEAADESRAAIFGSLKFESDRWQASMNMRQTFVDGYTVPFTPSAGVDYLLMKRPQHHMAIKGLTAFGYRVPTINDRYWQPGGNLDLQPEKSFSTELGIHGGTTGNSQFNYELTGFSMWVHDWILWLPGESYWSPKNVRSVISRGLEATTSAHHPIGHNSMKWQASYSFTSSVNQTGIDELDRSVGKQLPYVPLHNANISTMFIGSSWSVGLIADYTGKRYVTTDNESDLPAYWLLNVTAAKTFKAGPVRFETYARLNNILNTTYQNIKNKAMPGFNFNLGLNLKFKTL